MQLRFRTRKLQKQFEHYKEAEKAYGTHVARKYIQRVQLLQEARAFPEVMQLPGLGVHPLKGNRRGQYAARLTGAWRLIVAFEGSQLEIVCIEEVSDHYDD